MSVFALDYRSPSWPSIDSHISRAVHQRANEDWPHHAEWCHALATRGTAPVPDAGSLPLHSEAASQSTGSQERSADMQHYAPLSAAEYRSCPQLDWRNKHKIIYPMFHKMLITYITFKQTNDQNISDRSQALLSYWYVIMTMIDSTLQGQLSLLIRDHFSTDTAALTVHTVVVLSWRFSPLCWREMCRHPCGNGTAVWHPWTLASYHRLRKGNI